MTSSASKGIVAHEIGHSLGLWHEHQSPIRDIWVFICFPCIDPDNWHNYIRKTSGVCFMGYDFGSIMHYPRGGCINTELRFYGYRAINLTDFTKLTYNRLPAIGQRNRITDLDAEAVDWLHRNE